MGMQCNVVVLTDLVVQKLKTRMVRKNHNRECNEDLTLSTVDPNLPVKLTIVANSPHILSFKSIQFRLRDYDAPTNMVYRKTWVLKGVRKERDE